MLRALANPARLQLLNLLVRCPACVYELVTLTGYRQPYVSQQLAVLRRAGLVLAEQNRPYVRYHVACPELPVLLEVASQLPVPEQFASCDEKLADS